ncbi:phosphoenolpyruvate carboxykinase [Pseudozyma hubeiensis SY62]|uniref:Phosphoenolpyruvate carboxykinase n=1 Tax=Pseudozyma hubeiensis (strain SY62) TaxID=1305764 RepID=R9P0D7_PSEHS|nr:phosphoenolpyruvate carboxykinase [Pseudozyma hubeiensis SY62]GAC94596.1 phosphoenolpyruvate carboxykinase [Pseudozyma hubeiensis SY62]
MQRFRGRIGWNAVDGPLASDRSDSVTEARWLYAAPWIGGRYGERRTRNVNVVFDEVDASHREGSVKRRNF